MTEHGSYAQILARLDSQKPSDRHRAVDELYELRRLVGWPLLGDIARQFERSNDDQAPRTMAGSPKTPAPPWWDEEGAYDEQDRLYWAPRAD